jgi:hypothetical protein
LDLVMWCVPPHPPCCIAPRSCGQCGPQICNPPFRWHSSESQMGTRGITRPLTRTHTLWHHLKVRTRRIPEPDEVVELCCPELAGRRATVLGPTAFEDLQRPLVAVQLHEQAPRRTVREMPQQLLTLTTSGGCALLYRQWPEPTEPHKPLPHQRGHQYATEFDTVQAALAGGRLTELDLHSNYIGPEVGRKLLAALESCPALVARTLFVPSHPPLAQPCTLPVLLARCTSSTPHTLLTHSRGGGGLGRNSIWRSTNWTGRAALRCASGFQEQPSLSWTFGEMFLAKRGMPSSMPRPCHPSPSHLARVAVCVWARACARACVRVCARVCVRVSIVTLPRLTVWTLLVAPYQVRSCSRWTAIESDSERFKSRLQRLDSY